MGDSAASFAKSRYRFRAAMGLITTRICGDDNIDRLDCNPVRVDAEDAAVDGGGGGRGPGRQQTNNHNNKSRSSNIAGM